MVVWVPCWDEKGTEPNKWLAVGRRTHFSDFVRQKNKPNKKHTGTKKKGRNLHECFWTFRSCCRFVLDVSSCIPPQQQQRRVCVYVYTLLYRLESNHCPSSKYMILNGKGFTTTALSLGVGIRKGKLGSHFGFLPIHSGANHIQ